MKLFTHNLLICTKRSCGINSYPLKINSTKVEKVTTVNCKGKERRVGVHRGFTAKSKKAYVKLTESSKTIEFFDGMM